MDSPTSTPVKTAAAPGPRRGLGRGLDALLPSAPVPAPAAPTPVGDSVHHIELARIDPNPFQARQHFHPERLQELAESIRIHGIMQPIVVRARGERYMLIAGERRWRAAGLAGLPTVPAILRNVPDANVLELTLIENIQREDLNPIEIAEAFARLAAEARLTHEQIAERTGKDRATVTNLLRLLKLPPEVREKVASGQLMMGHAKALLALPSEAAQKTLAAQIVTQGLSVRQAETLAKALPPIPGKGQDFLKKIQNEVLQDPNVRAAVAEMERALGTKVRIVGDYEMGKIVIEYYTSNDLDRIWNKLMGK